MIEIKKKYAELLKEVQAHHGIQFPVSLLSWHFSSIPDSLNYPIYIGIYFLFLILYLDDLDSFPLEFNNLTSVIENQEKIDMRVKPISCKSLLSLSRTLTGACFL